MSSIPTLEIPSFDAPVMEDVVATPEVARSEPETKEIFKPEIPVFEIPTLEIDTTPKESTYTLFEAPKAPVHTTTIAPIKPIIVAPEEVIDLDAIDAQFGASSYQEPYFEEPTFDDDENIALTDDDGVRKTILVEG